MRRAALLLLVSACGRTTPYPRDVPTPLPRADAGALACFDCDAGTVDTFASCSITADCDVLDGEGRLCFSDGGCPRVLAYRRFGHGRVLAYGDGTSFGHLYGAMGIEALLTSEPAPRVASFGDDFGCRPTEGGAAGYEGLPKSVHYLGTGFVGRLDDWDLVIWCAIRPWAYDAGVLPARLDDFVSNGGGLAVTYDYQLAKVPETDRLNQAIAPFGLQFESNVLGWGPMRACISR